MTDKEKEIKAKEYSIKITPFLLRMVAHKTKDTYSEEQLQEGYLAGYEQGFTEGRKEKWHDLRKDPNDLPTETGQYLTDYDGICIYDTDSKKWRTLRCSACWDFDWLDDNEIIAWCEIPKFKE